MQPWAELSLALSGLQRELWNSPRAALEWAAAQGLRALHLDATMPGLRPRELDASARRGVAAVFRQLELRLTGFDLWIPSEHFARADTQQRALDAVEAAIIFAADLRAIAPAATVCVRLPAEPGPWRDHFASTANHHGIVIADFNAAAAVGDPIMIGLGVDPAEALQHDEDPAKLISKAGRSLACARVSDAQGTRRVALGHGKFDATAYAIALATAGYALPVVLDIREVDPPEAAVQAGREAWPPL